MAEPGAADIVDHHHDPGPPMIRKVPEMDDQEIRAAVSRLVDQEHQLERAHIGEGLSEPELQQLRAVEVQLDACWDLLRQRQARRAAGVDPDGATVRGADVVERYLQ